MRKISILDRVLLLAAGLLSAYQIAVGLNGKPPLTVWFYTVGFGILLVAGLLLIILGFEGLENQGVVIISTLIPLSISLGLVSEHLARITYPYLILSVFGFGAIAITRFIVHGKIATIVLAVVHGIAGMIIFLLPLILWFAGKVPAGYGLVSLGGSLIGIGGLLLAFLKSGRPLLSEDRIYSLLPIILFLMTGAFVLGFSTY
jgi:hypothetical protein